MLFTLDYRVYSIMPVKELEGKVALSLDAWTSSNQHVFLAIVAHYITNDGQLGTMFFHFPSLVGNSFIIKLRRRAPN
jgi:hypothetical protein